MKKCNTELMKELKEIQELIEFAKKREEKNCTLTYTEMDSDTPETPTDYDYEFARKEIYDLQKEERRIKNLLAISNATTQVQGFNMTLAEALVYLAQLSQNKVQLSAMANRSKLERTQGYRGYTEYTKALYDIKKAQSDLVEVNREIAKLQMAIDRTNLTNLIEV